MAQTSGTAVRSISLGHLLNEHVRDLEDRDIGKVEDLVLDADSGMVDFAVVKFGGFLGMGANYHVIPWQKLQVDMDTRSFRMDVTKEQVDRAPAFDSKHVPSTDDNEYMDSVFGYWGIDRSQHQQRMQQARHGGSGAETYAQSGEYRSSESASRTTGMGAQGSSGYGTAESSRAQAGYGGTGQQEYAESAQPGYGGTRQQGYSESAQEGYAQRETASQQPQQGGWISSGSSQAGGVDYGNGQRGPDRRTGGYHENNYTGIERRAGW